MPEAEPMVATPVLPLAQVPLPLELPRVAVEPVQTEGVPVNEVGAGFTVTVEVVWQLVPMV